MAAPPEPRPGQAPSAPGPLDPARVGRILVIKWSALGDLAVASAAMEDLRRAFPRAEMHLNTMPPWDRLFREDPRFARVLALPLRRQGPRASLRWLREVAKGGYDLVVDLQANDRSRLLLAALRLALAARPGARRPFLAGNQGGFPYHIPRVALPEEAHAAERMRTALAALGVPAVARRPVLHVPPRHEERARRLLAEAGLVPGGFAVFLPGCQAAGYLKRWGAARYAALGRRLLARGLRVALLGAADEAEECAAIAEALGEGAANLCGRTEVLDLLPLCARARCIVGNDTGTAHLAAATGVPMVVLFGPTDPRRARPLGPQVRALQAPLPCINCYRKHCPDLGQRCMAELRPEQVEEALAALGAL
ncbi:MAG: glycosyltransferase family 9 protein [Gammaproteobacteria bacterium]|nr:MAG: glycosyltransferase family 9 protein [Gammaproteobacteria bacterium]